MKAKMKLNLQMHSSLFGPEGPPSDVTNPLLDDPIDEPVDNPVDELVDDVKEDTSLDTNTSITNNDTSISSLDFNTIATKLDSILNRIEKPPVIDKVEDVPNQELTEEQIEQMNNEFYLKFTEKPLEALEELIEERANKKIEPLLNHFKQIEEVEKWNNTINSFEKENPDFKEYINDIVEIINGDEGIRNSKDPLAVAYKLAKSERLEKQYKETLDKQNTPLSELVKDQNNLKELLSNPEIKNLVVQELMLNKKDIPKVIGTDGKTSVNISDKPKSIEDATKAWLNQ